VKKAEAAKKNNNNNNNNKVNYSAVINEIEKAFQLFFSEY
jgi:hypothetical protein